MGRLEKLPPYLFAEIDEARDRARAAGRDVIDLGVGDPDRPTPAALVEFMAQAIREPADHRYPSYQGKLSLRRAIAGYLAERHGVDVDPERQVLVLIGSKEGLAHLPLALLEEGDRVLAPDPGYPVYGEAAILAGGVPVPYPLTEERGFRPDPAVLDGLIDDRTRLVILNHPHNPTGAAAGPELFAAMVEVARRRGVALVNDAAYLEVVLSGERPASLLAAADLARDRVLEFHSFSKMFNMTGWRIGFAAGSAELIAALGRVKKSVDSGVFGAIQRTVEHALGGDVAGLLAEVAAPYAGRRRLVEEALAASGIEVFPTATTFYVWARVPDGGDSASFARRVLRECDVVVTPGTGFGPGGEGWFRISLTAPDERIAAAAERLGRL